jgi:short-subunit dehydrogenase
MEIDRKNIVITGASSGIGYSILKACLDFDCKIVAAAQNGERLEELIASYRDRVFPFTGNLGDPFQLDRLFEFAMNRLGSIDIFIANAGYAYYESLGKADWSHIEQIFRVNTFSPIYSILKMRELNAGESWKTVVISSAIAVWALPGYAIYGATKSAVNHFLKSYRLDNDRRKVMIVYPISTSTGFFERAGKSVPVSYPLQTPETVAKKIIKGILNDKQLLYPSPFFQTLKSINQYLPFIEKIYQQMQLWIFRKWLKKSAYVDGS